VVPISLFAPVYEQYGLTWGDDYPTQADLAGWASDAGWATVTADADPTVSIPLADDDAFGTWLQVGSRGRATKGWADERRRQFARDLMAATPRDPDGGYRLPFGALYLTATRSS
jgi:hypothetical protein